MLPLCRGWPRGKVHPRGQTDFFSGWLLLFGRIQGCLPVREHPLQAVQTLPPW